MEAVGTLAAGLAHDMNNVLAAVVGFAELSLGRCADPEMRSDLQEILREGRRGAELTHGLLAFSRRGQYRKQIVAFGDVVENVLPLLARTLPKSIVVRDELGAGAACVEGDPAQLGQVVVNLSLNAADAMTGGGTLSIATDVIELDGPRAASNRLAPGRHVALRVSDTGIGMDEATRRRVFEPFFTTKPIGKGTGLGLSQVHGFAHQAGGTVRVSSELGRGTTVTILLPREQVSPQSDHIPALDARGSGTVLLVEDNPEVASVSTALLEQLGYIVRRAGDAEAALREIERDGIDLVFSDIIMPGKMDGLGLAVHLKQIRPGLPILLATGYSDAAVNVRGDFPILRKPYEIHQLSEAIAKLPRQ